MKWFSLTIISLVLIACNIDKTDSVPYQPVLKTDLNLKEIQLVHFINQHRKSIGLDTLKVELLASELAKNHVQYMIENDSISHDFFYQRFIDSKAKFCGEIVAFNFITSQSMFAAYMSSPPHKAVIENPNYDWIGISIIDRTNCCLLTKY